MIYYPGLDLAAKWCLMDCSFCVSGSLVRGVAGGVVVFFCMYFDFVAVVVICVWCLWVSLVWVGCVNVGWMRVV